MGNWLSLCELLHRHQSNGWWGRKKHLSFTLLCFFGGEIIDKKKYSGTDLHLWATVHILLPCYYCRCGGHSVPALRQLRSSCSMKQHHVDCGCLSVLGSHKQAAGYCFQMSCNTSPPPKAVPCLLFFLLLCFSQYSVTCFSESGVQLVCDTCLFMAAVQRKTSGVTSLFLFLSFFLLLQSLFFFLPAVSLLVFALSVPSLLIQTGPIILSVPAESIGRGMSRLFRKSLPHPRQSDHSHTLFQTMKLKYPLEENSKIKKMKSFEQKLHFLFFILQLGNKKKKKSFHNYFAVSLWGNIYGFRGWVASRSVFPCLYTTVFMWRGDGRQETEPLQQGPRGSVLPSPALYEAVFWTEAQDQAWGTLLRSSLSRAPTLTDITSAGGRHSRPCVRARRSVDAPFSLLLWSKTKWCAHPSSLLVLKAWGVISGGKREKGG